jgi:hypothetical protein
LKSMTYLILFTLITTLFTSAHAATVYRHIPVDVSLDLADSLVVNYDYTEKRGIRCASNYNKFWIDFVYKGHQKSARLPLILQSDHVPENDDEELADTSGQFIISTNKNQTRDKRVNVRCDYVVSQ